MKGITPVIAIILLLLITISMVGFAFVWFQRVATTATTSSEQQLTNQLNIQSQKIKIEGASATTVTLRNTGSITLPAASIVMFINGTSATSGNCPSASQASGAIFTCTTTINTCSGSSTLRASAPGNADQITC
ncbi:MAG TPA: archaellin/type IV pilin N-terminal domain-containing protein [archaeon]|nr:archaellin/type IV pilin N-terminal domain-containing protein [archaeon]